MKRLVGYKELSEFTGYSVHTLYTYVYKGLIPFYKSPSFRGPRFDLEEISAMMCSGHHNSVSQIVANR